MLDQLREGDIIGVSFASMRCASLFAVFFLAIGSSSSRAERLNSYALEQRLTDLIEHFDGRIGVCVQSNKEIACVRAEERFSLQSVMKLVVGFAVLEAVDNRGWQLDQQVIIRRKDLSLNVQPLARLVGASGYRTSIGDLVRRAIIESDSAAVDYLVGRLGGPGAVQAALKRKGVSGIRLDRDERHLQTDRIWPIYLSTVAVHHEQPCE